MSLETTVEQGPESITHSEETSVWDTISTWCVYLIAFLTPIWFLPFTISPVDSNKFFLVTAMVIVGFIAWLGRAVHTGNITIPKSSTLAILFLWLLTIFFSAYFSLSRSVSLWGVVPSSFLAVLTFSLVAFLSASSLRGQKNIERAYVLLFTSAGIAGLFVIVRTVFNLDFLPWAFGDARTFNTIGQWNAVAIFFGFLLVSIVPLLGRVGSKLSRVSLIVLALVALLLTTVVNFPMVWLGIGLMSLVFLAYSISRATNRKFGIPLALLLVSVLMLLAREDVARMTRSLNAPLDITPSISTSFEIGKQAIKDRPLLGTGPGTFGDAWDLYRDPVINQTEYWRLRFGSGSSFVTTLPTTTGILGTLVFLLFVGSVVWLGIKAFSNSNDSNRNFVLSGVFGILFLVYSWFVYPLTITTGILSFLALGLFIAQARERELIKSISVQIVADSPKGFVAALLIILCMVGGIVGLYVAGEKYVAAIYYGQGVARLNLDGSINTATDLFRRAALLDASRDQYHRAIAEMSFLKLQRIVAEAGDKAPEDVRTNFQIELSNAITSARATTESNPANSSNWRMLGQIYEAVIPFVDGSSDAALEAYTKASERSPQDPVIYDDKARVYIALGDYVKGREELEKAIALKNDYSTAHFRLAQIAALKGNINEAIKSTENAVVSAPNDVGVVFQLGLLYYQKDRLPDAQAAFEHAVSLNKNYSNARYFLGLVYGRRGEYDKAVAEFEKVLELNPGNEEVEKILANVRAHRNPLAGISPPSADPLERSNPPLNDEAEVDSPEEEVSSEE